MDIFNIDKDKLAKEKQRFWQPNEFTIYFDNAGFHVSVCIEEKRLQIVNTSHTATRSLPIGRNYKLHCKERLD
ncbi:hypothetical protein [Nostoc sp.]|uniref:hypothetical protein n=1 Tax=Nostoc sp. TaxID=1180 RepID=UPI002FFC4537